MGFVFNIWQIKCELGLLAGLQGSLELSVQQVDIELLFGKGCCCLVQQVLTLHQMSAQIKFTLVRRPPALRQPHVACENMRHF